MLFGQSVEHESLCQKRPSVGSSPVGGAVGMGRIIIETMPIEVLVVVEEQTVEEQYLLCRSLQQVGRCTLATSLMSQEISTHIQVVEPESSLSHPSPAVNACFGNTLLLSKNVMAYLVEIILVTLVFVSSCQFGEGSAHSSAVVKARHGEESAPRIVAHARSVFFLELSLYFWFEIKVKVLFDKLLILLFTCRIGKIEHCHSEHTIHVSPFLIIAVDVSVSVLCL